MGTAFFLIGFFIAAYLIISKLINWEFPITNRPGFYLALTTIIIGMQLFLAGFISELVARNAPARNHYLIEERVGFRETMKEQLPQ